MRARARSPVRDGRDPERVILRSSGPLDSVVAPRAGFIWRDVAHDLAWYFERSANQSLTMHYNSHLFRVDVPKNSAGLARCVVRIGRDFGLRFQLELTIQKS